MGTRPVDFRSALVADLPRGRLESRDKQRLVALPSAWLVSLVQSAGLRASERATLGEALARSLEPELRAVLEGDEFAPEDLAYAASVALALRGLGTVEFERWGDALTLLWHDLPAQGEVWEDLASSAAASLVQSIVGLDVTGAPVGWVDGSLRIFLSSPEACAKTAERVRAGESFLQALARLERGGAEG